MVLAPAIKQKTRFFDKAGLFSDRLNKRLKMLHFKRGTSIFSHPDYTVGSGISPNPA
ncbi:hypothetical protein CHCC20335_3647 [Bacillus paralicheniformis]|nr:hypothetical protein CHCC20335_3647 [Bacillus paralicheniformis]GIN67919.1 hypothetical protein J41TS2_33400 [Bacillus sonorensis]